MHPTTPITRPSFEDTAVAFAQKSDAELRRMYWLFATMNNPRLVRWGTRVLTGALKLRLPVAPLVRPTVFQHFCGGETIADCEPTIRTLAKAGIGTILDYSVEGEKTEAGFEATAREILATIERAAGSPEVPFSVFKLTGLAPFDLLAKRQRGEALTPAEAKAWAGVEARVDRICAAAHAQNVCVFVDGEESWIQQTIDQLAYRMMARYNRERTIVYNTYQMYRWESLDLIRRAHAQAQAEGYYLGVKLVRGAYMEKERTRAQQLGYRDPIQPSKEASDRDFNDALVYCLANRDGVALCAGTHNEYSCHFLIELMHQYGLAPDDARVWFAQLYGMSDNISHNLAHAGYRVAKYVPYGPVHAVMPYLVRRAEENTSIAGQSSREFALIRREVQRRRQPR